MLPTNFALLRIAKRAESQDDSILQKTFVDFGSILTVVTGVDHQIIYGRRGTGKTHLLTRIRQHQVAAKQVAAQIDMRLLGSAGGIYADPMVPMAERATRLLMDVLTTIQSKVLSACVEGHADVSLVGGPLNDFVDALSNITVVGETIIESSVSAESAGVAELKLGINVAAAPSLTASAGSTNSSKDSVAVKKTVKGKEVYRVNFGSVSSALSKVVAMLPGKRLWLLFDEWSEVPLELQPILSDMLGRAIMPVTGVVVKIAAIEYRSRFLEKGIDNIRLGLEVGADISSGISLDEFMVFDNDEARAGAFFRKLVFLHVRSAIEDENKRRLEELKNLPSTMPEDDPERVALQPMHNPKNEAELLSSGFTQSATFDEVVRACEGVPRDAINILSQAAQRAGDQAISIDIVRQAAQKWYQTSKAATINSHSHATALLQWIIDKVIKERQAKAFLLKSGVKDPLIEYLYDQRVLHLLREGISSKELTGVRFNVYAIDYGCYVDLITTARAPKGLFDISDTDNSEFVSTVPATDFRSIRRCVLDLEDFYENNPPIMLPN